MKKPLVIANWKMYIESPEEAKAFVSGLKRLTRRPTTEGKLSKTTGVEVWVAPPDPFIPELVKATKGTKIKIGAQTASPYEGGHTGEVSAAMLKSVGAQFCIVGHSERRAMGESNSMVHDALVHAGQAALAPVLCVGELERKEDGSHFAFIEEQLRSALKGAQSMANKLVVAYEPVWAIGKTAAQAMPAQELEETAIFIRKTLAEILGRSAALRVAILYGGSVEGENAARLLHEGGVNGFLVGHASAKLKSFNEILDAVLR